MDRFSLDDNLLKEAITRACDEDYFNFMTSFKGFHIFSREFERNMNIMIKKYNSAIRATKRKIVRLKYFLITIAILIVSIVIILGVEPLRESLFELFRNILNSLKTHF